MQFPGYWVSSDDKQIVITRENFDDTEISEETDWKKAHRNEDASVPHGFVLWEAAVADIERRIKGMIACPPMQENRDV